MKFTSRSIDALTSSGRELEEYWDEDFRGFGIRVSNTGTKKWIYYYRFDGRRRRFTIGEYPLLSLADARDRAKKLALEIANGIDPMAAKVVRRDSLTVEELVHEFIERYAKQEKSSWEEDERILGKELLPKYGRMKAQDLKKADVRLVIELVRERGAKVQSNRTLKIIRRLYNWGIECDLVENNPCLGVKKLTKELPRDRVLTVDEIRKVWQAIESEPNEIWEGTLKDKEKIKGIFKFYLLTGQRGAEIKNMEWAEIDWAERVWVIPQVKMKTRQPHRVPLCSTVLKLLTEIRSRNWCSRWVFPSPYRPGKPISNIQKAVQRLRAASGVKFNAHDLRRTVASHMTGMGTPRLTVSKILGHAESGVTSIYDQHSYDDEKRMALERWEVKIRNIVGLNKADVQD